ncbi:aldehyde dehydrogenase family protein [Frankia sp. AgB1.9]|uniref:aldehyde dehydrogenase family protein n=1 Tax=unclassified Frankia TaxID=2632575 RepID=UPI00193167B6|nr:MULTISPECIES: aldehyde dehydrogenase family protein [unclassified Frankia]MBL7493557.1 aldehyde dehydrogenase family protein [Frankia sp. AgW1.1]MBL7549818.1 aldehyde dehydrogenase family protein [Frankia sp. AgB1.9]MBL7622426.1 aldehyde dehydrogenase family protein [Frankia sp. AgB1.8]
MSGESRLLIGGKLTDAASGRTFDNINPATEEILGSTADAGLVDLDAAIASARVAFDTTTWSTDRALRKRCLLQLQEALEREREEIRAELVAEVGCPVATTYMAQLELPLEDALRWPARTIDEFPWERELSTGNQFGMRSWRKAVKEPVGVVGAITPWNYPLEITLGKLGQILATGNTLVLKPAPDTPWTTTRIGRLIAEHTDIPPGVVNVVASADHALGEALVDDPRVDLISFTGSTATGRRIMERGAIGLKRLFLELGGKSADIVLDDADLPAKLAFASFVCVHAGQGCAMTTRLLVPRSRYEEAVELVAASFATVPYGDPTDPANIQGPQVSARQRDRVLGYVEAGLREGARLVTGGGRPSHLPKGFYVEPTLFADVDNTMTIAREEIFGPVLVMIPFEDDDDAVRIANDSPYGLSGAVTSGSEERALAVASRLKAGTVSVNGGIYYGADVPFGGRKASGVGRQNGVEGFEQYLETKSIAGLAAS